MDADKDGVHVSDDTQTKCSKASDPASNRWSVPISSLKTKIRALWLTENGHNETYLQREEKPLGQPEAPDVDPDSSSMKSASVQASGETSKMWFVPILSHQTKIWALWLKGQEQNLSFLRREEKPLGQPEAPDVDPDSSYLKSASVQDSGETSKMWFVPILSPQTKIWALWLKGQGQNLSFLRREEKPLGQPEAPNVDLDSSSKTSSSGQKESILTEETIKRYLPLAVAAASTGAVLVAVPLVICAAGFGAGGITAGSLGATMMSGAAINGFGMAVVSTLQSAGAAGLAVGTKVGIASATSVTTGKLTQIILQKTENKDGKEMKRDGLESQEGKSGDINEDTNTPIRKDASARSKL